MDRLKSSIKTLEETKKTLQADKAAVTGEKMNLELQLKSTSAKMLALEKENEKLREKAGKIGEARSEAQQVLIFTAHLSMSVAKTVDSDVFGRLKHRLLKKLRKLPWLWKTTR